MDWRHGAAALGALILIGLIMTSMGSAEEADFDEVTVHLSPDCGCCIQHAQYLERAGVDVEIIEHSNAELQQLWDEKEIPEGYRSCHLTEIEDEERIADVNGHVPIDVFNQVVEEQPETEIVSLPGMPSGSPGMPGTQTEEWIFYNIENGEVTGEFTTQ